MTLADADADDHPWYLDLRPDPVSTGRDSDVIAALRALDAVSASVLEVHVDPLPSLAEIVAGHCYVGWTILIPGTVDQQAIEEITATVGAGYRVTLAPGHPLPSSIHHAASPAIDRPASHRHAPPARPSGRSPVAGYEAGLSVSPVAGHP